MNIRHLMGICLGLFFILSSFEVFAQEAAPKSELQDEPLQAESYQERVRREGNVLDLSLRDAIRLALTNNLEIAIEDFNEDLNRERIVGTKGFYDPILSFQVGWNSIEFPTTSVLQAGAGVPSQLNRTMTLNSSFRQNVVGGGAFSLSFDNNRQSTNSAFSFVNPSFGSNFTLNFTQPLMRGFRRTQTERQLHLFNLDTQISDSQFQQRVADIVEQVQQQYWEMVFAIENFETQRKAMDLAIVQFRNNEKRVEIGVTAPIEITASRAEVATREQEMIQSEVQIVTAQNALKRLLAPDPGASIWNLSLLPTDRPVVRDVAITLEDAIRMALERRPELDQMKYQLEKNEVDRSYYLREGKPSVNLVTSFGSVGRAGQVFQNILIDTNGDGIPDTPAGRAPNPDHPLFGSFGGAMGTAFAFDFINYNIGLQVEIPLRNRSNDANLAQVNIAERQLMSQVKNQQQLIIVDVRNAFEGIAIQKKRLDAARVARHLSEEKLDGETKRFQAGLSTNFEVLSFQRDLAEAQVRELRAVIDYQLALTSLEKAMYTIIDGNDIVVAREQNARH